ncbi:Protein O-mannosyl-transferase 2, partial [Orchesella cincta]
NRRSLRNSTPRESPSTENALLKPRRWVRTGGRLAKSPLSEFSDDTDTETEAAKADPFIRPTTPKRYSKTFSNTINHNHSNHHIDYSFRTANSTYSTSPIMARESSAKPSSSKGAQNKSDHSPTKTKSSSSSSDTQKQKSQTSSQTGKTDNNDTHWSWGVFLLILVLGIGTRFYKVEEPDHVCWDETHFGKMGSWYINRTFFFDVHPPLGKMMVGAFGYLTGYNGTFPFESPGQKYNETKYVGMRVCCTALGSMLVPLTYLTVWEMTESTSAACLAAAFILFDVGLLTLTQYILLDPILLFFISGSVYTSVKFYTYRNNPFTLVWWTWLVLSGVFIACAISVKFVGLFTVLYIGFRTIYELWEILGDLSQPITYTLKHFIARAICLIALPFALYVTFFYIHLAVLNRSGNGDGFYSSAFQSQLIGNPLYNASMPREVAYGAIVSLKSQRTGGGYLHSHWHLYPEGVGAKQQQITTYAHKDENNKWIIKKFDEAAPKLDNETAPIELIKNGDLIRLEHLVTKRNLHSHRLPAPVTKKQWQVTGYGENGTGDANDVWRIDVVGGKPGDSINVVSSRLRFIHQLQNCILSGTGKQLPKWAYEQMEVSCAQNHRDVRKSTYWNIEENHFPRLPNISFQVHAPNFIEKFVESHTIMFEGNAGLKPKEGEVTSRPWQWPINYRGQYFSGSTYRIYLLGNPVIWWANLALLPLFAIIYIYNAWKEQRGYEENVDTKAARDKTVTVCCWLFVGWALHYLPFYTMGRVLYFHHYFPALLFSSMLSAVIIDYFIGRLMSTVSFLKDNGFFHVMYGLTLSSVAYSFYLFAPLSYGTSGPLAAEENSTMHGLKWLDSWEF